MKTTIEPDLNQTQEPGQVLSQKIREPSESQSVTDQRAQRAYGWLTWTLILVTIAVGAYLRFRNLGQIPPGLHFDEAANGMDGLNVWKGQLHIFFPANIRVVAK